MLDGVAAVIGAAAGPEPGSARGRALSQIWQGHVAHRAALVSTTPTARPTGNATPTPTVSASAVNADAKRALSSLRAGEQEASKAYLALAASTQGVVCLLWASLGSASAGYELALTSSQPPAPAPAARERTTLVPPSEVQALQSMVAQLHAVVYGYQLVIGRLKGERRVQATASLRRHRVLLDRLVELLTDRAEDVPAAAPAYVPPIRPTDAAKAAELVARMEVALLPWVGQWVAAAAAAPDRGVAVRALLGGTRTAVGWGSALPAWPGWPD
ncbi:MAG: hypothetical protein JWN06_25 [Propionibacteriaceae bacterium]|nr:hypothetical protein [Propionibacteriaceae bacterium]